MSGVTEPSAARADWIRLLSATAVFLAFSMAARLLPRSSPWLLPALLASVVPVVVVVAVFVRMLRRTDELARRVVSESLALAFVVTLAAMFLYPFVEMTAAGSLRPQVVAALLVTSFSLGIAIFSRRYE